MITEGVIMKYAITKRQNEIISLLKQRMPIKRYC